MLSTISWQGMGLALICVSLAFAQAAEPVRLYPVDDSGRDSGFRSFVRKLQKAVDQQDTAALRKLVDIKEVVSGPGKEDKGWSKFTERWRPEDDKGPLWPALSRLLSLGFIQEHPGLFLSPYLVWRFPPGLPVRDPMVITRDKVALRDSPSARADIVGYLSFDIVERLSSPQQKDGLVQWVYVRSFDGKTGYVNAKDAESPIMARGQFGLIDGRWLMIGLEAPEE